jgi:dolichyl-phosphate beta-glucosyltransferase
VNVIGSAERRGKGRGVREAVALARGSIIGYADADNKVPIEEYAKLDEWFRRGLDIVIGSRVLARSVIERSQPWYRRAGSRLFNRAMRVLTGLTDVADSQCGFKFFRRDAAKEIFGRQQIDGYMFDVEILVLVRKLGYRMQQVPIRWRDDGDTRLQLVRGNLQNLRDLWRIRIGAARSAER